MTQSEHQTDPDVATFLRTMAARARFRSTNCFDLAAASELRSLADDLDSKATSLEPAFRNGDMRPGNGKLPSE